MLCRQDAGEAPLRVAQHLLDVLQLQSRLGAADLPARQHLLSGGGTAAASSARDVLKTMYWGAALPATHAQPG
jgi:hypothetical protein